MMKLRLDLALFSLLALSACDNEPKPKALPAFDDDEAEQETSEQNAEAGEQAKPERKGPQYAVINSDYKSTSVSLLGLSGQLLAEDYINSGSAQAGLVTLLSGDVEMPTQSNDPGVLVLIDRYRTDVITRIRLSDAKILGQVKTHTPAAQDTKNAYTSNPNDYVRISDDTAWVTRNQPNLDPSVPDIDKGNDLLRINPSTMERTDERIDLSSLNAKGTRINPDTKQEEEVDVYARPSRMARVGDTLIVGLTRNAFDFSANGTGMVALVDLETKSVNGLELPDFVGCTKVSQIPNDAERVLVSCGGDSSKVRETAGYAIVRLQKGRASIELAWRAQDHDDVPALSGSSVALGGTLIGASANQYFGDVPSVFGVLDLKTSAYTELASITAGGTFGAALYDAETERLFVPDASTDSDLRPTGGLHLFERAGDTFAESSVLKVAEETTLPVRHIFPL